jgi:RNA polymerase sigma-70 factor (ECF subfamily)
LKNKEDKAFEYLYKKYAKALYNAVFQIIGDTETSNDLLQQIFITIWQKIDKYDAQKGRLFTWMLQISRNISIDYLRSKTNKNTQKNQSLTDSVHSNSIPANDGINIDAIGIKKFVDALKEEYKDVLIQSYYQGYTHEEIAVNLQIPIGTVKTRIRASLIQLRKKMLEN